MTLEQIGEAIRDRRERCCWSQSEVARRAGVEHSTVAALEEARGSNLSTLIKIVTVLGANLEIV